MMVQLTIAPPIDLVKLYDTRYSREERQDFSENGLDPVTVNSFYNLHAHQVLQLCLTYGLRNASSNFLLAIPSWHSKAECIHEAIPGVDLCSILDQYPNTISSTEIDSLVRRGIASQGIVPYLQYFDGFSAGHLAQAAVSLEQALPFLPHFGNRGRDIVFYVGANFKACDAVAYDQAIPGGAFGPEVLALRDIGFSAGDIADLPGTETFQGTFGTLLRTLPAMQYDMMQLLGSGQDAIVLYDKISKVARKYSFTNAQEYALLKKVEQNNSSVNNVVRAFKFNDGVLELEYVEGKTLRSYLIDNSFTGEEVLNLGKGLINGLCELRRGGILNHNDITWVNVLYDEVNTRLVIIDLGLVQDGGARRSISGSRFGGSNDLQMVGHILYNMMTKEILFGADGRFSTRNKAEIRKNRQDAYKDAQLWASQMRSMDDKVGNEKLSIVIRSCLEAKPYHLGMIRRILNSTE